MVVMIRSGAATARYLLIDVGDVSLATIDIGLLIDRPASLRSSPAPVPEEGARERRKAADPRYCTADPPPASCGHNVPLPCLSR
jgi:hypothetical protein